MSSAVSQGNPVDQTFRMIPYVDLHESKHNPRRHFDDAAMKELVDSIQKVGILTPLLVRPNEKGFEIAAGHRRYRASVSANVKVLPCVVRPMDDQTFMEILTIENLQREDVHALDEAKGYEALMAPPYRMKVEALASKVGKSVRYIYDSRKLLDLTKEAQELFWDGHIDKSHAVLLARLSPTDQAKVIGSKEDNYTDGGLFQGMRGLPYDQDAEEMDELKACSVRELEAYIDDHVRFDRQKVDQILFPETAEKIQTEVTKAKSTGVLPDPKKTVVPITREFVLNDDTRDKGERTYTSRSWKRADGLQGSKTCEYAMLGCVVAGAHRGESFEVCIDKKLCTIHWKDEVKAAEAKVNGTSKAVKAAEEKVAKARKAEQEQAERKREKRAHWEKMATKIRQAVLDRVKQLPATANGVLADLLIKAVTGHRGKVTSVPRGKSAEDLVRHLAAIVLASDVTSWEAWEQFPPIARAIGVDLSPFVKLEVQTSAQKKKGKAA